MEHISPFLSWFGTLASCWIFFSPKLGFLTFQAIILYINTPSGSQNTMLKRFNTKSIVGFNIYYLYHSLKTYKTNGKLHEKICTVFACRWPDFPVGIYNIQCVIVKSVLDPNSDFWDKQKTSHLSNGTRKNCPESSPLFGKTAYDHEKGAKGLFQLSIVWLLTQ